MGELVLGIETSCDETAAAVLEGGHKIRSSIVASQAKVHAPYGGIVPELASRRHLETIGPVIRLAVHEAGIEFGDLTGLAVTVGPGLVGSLLVGVSAAKGLAYSLRKPLVAVNHIEGHLYAGILDHPHLEPPYVALVASGGHTHLYHAESPGIHRLLGCTRDDAAGEAFDKVAKTLGLPYPGGPEISRLAAYARSEKLPTLLKLPRPMMTSDDYDFSFSGLKTAVERYVQAHELRSLDREKLACEFEDSVTDVLVYKTLRAVEEYGVNAVVMGGGVSANKYIR